MVLEFQENLFDTRFADDKVDVDVRFLVVGFCVVAVVAETTFVAYVQYG